MIDTALRRSIERGLARSRGRKIYNYELDSALIINLCSCKKDTLLVGSSSVCITAVSDITEYLDAGFAGFMLVGDEGTSAVDGDYCSKLVCVQYSGMWLKYDQLPPSIIQWLMEHGYKRCK